jgi:hypothetical protein
MFCTIILPFVADLAIKFTALPPYMALESPMEEGQSLLNTNDAGRHLVSEKYFI